MLEKGRAIPSTQTVPVVSRPTKSAPIMVEGRVSTIFSYPLLNLNIFKNKVRIFVRELIL